MHLFDTVEPKNTLRDDVLKQQQKDLISRWSLYALVIFFIVMHLHMSEVVAQKDVRDDC